MIDLITIILSRRRWARVNVFDLMTLVLLGSASALVTLPHAMAEEEQLSRTAPPSFSISTDPKPVAIRIGGHEFQIPANHLEDPRHASESEGVLITALLPDMQGRTHDNWDAFMKVPGWGRRVYVLVRILNIDPQAFLERFLKTKQKNSAPLKDQGIVYGLERNTPDIPEQKIKWQKDMFVEKNDNTLSSFITCTVEKTRPYPGCTHYFTVENILFKISYGRQHLERWQSIQNKVVALFENFHRAPGSGAK